MNFESTVISNFWNAVIASVILVATAMLLVDNEHLGKILILEGLFFGVRSGNEFYKTYKEDPSRKSK